MVKIFLKNLFFFLFPLLVILLLFDYYLGNYPSTFQLKAKYINENKADVEVLVLGSSHNQTAINPEFIKNKKLANFAFGGQDYKLDFKLLDKYISQLPKLKMVVFEMAYHSLETENGQEYERNSLYLRFCGVNNFGRRNNPKDYSIFLSNPEHYLSFLNPFAEKTEVNKFGFATELSKFEEGSQRFKKLNYDIEKINNDRNNSFIQRHKVENIKVYKKNKGVFEKMISLCVLHHVIPVIVIPPVYKSYYEEMLPKKKERRDDFAEYIIRKYPSALLYDFEKSEKFFVTDFMNEDHLNPDGAKKFTQIIDSVLVTRKY